MPNDQKARQYCEFYRDVFGGWRWEAYDRNGDSIDSRLSFASAEDCVRDARRAGIAVAGPAQRSGLCVMTRAESREMLGEALGSHRLVLAQNAYEALRNLHSDIFDFYVIEYWLPDLSGMSLCREIRKIDPSAPIVFCSATERDDARRRALNAGANEYLTRPIDTQLLRERLHLLLDRADCASLLAKPEEELAIDAEIARWVKAAALAGKAEALTASATERAARAKANKAFLASGGTRANFERSWPQVWSAAWATHRDGIREHQAP